MAAGFGADPTKDGSGNITSGTTSQDIRNINAGLYSPGVISGCKVTLSSTGMTYQVSAGVAAVQMTTGEVVLVAVPATTINAASVPSSGSRTDYIYVYQNTPGVEGNSTAYVTYGASVPPQKALQIDAYTVPAGATTTSGGVKAASVTYSIPYSGGLGTLYRYNYTIDGVLPNNTAATLSRIGNGTIYLPTDRMVKWSLVGVFSAVNASGFDNSHYVEYAFLPRYDTLDFVLWTSGGLHQAWQTVYFEQTVQMSAGTHNVSLGVFRGSGPGTAYCHYGYQSDGYFRQGMVMTLTDAGIVQ